MGNALQPGAKARQKILQVVTIDANYKVGVNDDVIEASANVTCTLPTNPRVGDSHQFVAAGGVITFASSYPIAQGVTSVPLNASNTLTFSHLGKWIPQFAATLGNSVLVWGNSSIPHATATYNLTPFYTDSPASAFVLQYRIPASGKIRKLYVHVGAPFGNGENIVYTLRVNGVDTTLTATLASTGSDASDLVHEVDVVAGDLLELTALIAVDCAVDPGAVFVTAEFSAAA